MSDIRARLVDALQNQDGWDLFTPEAAVDVLLSLPGIAVVELPALPSSGVVTDGRWVLDQSWYADQRMRPRSAREHAAALLAAANAAAQQATP